jgi:hypothetical protein
MTAAQAKPTFGTSPNYIPQEFPKAGRNGNGQSVTAKDQEHQSQLEAVGFTFPQFHPHVPGNVDHNGNIPQEYPRAVFRESGKSTLARNPDHEAELESQGWSRIPPVEEAKPPQPAMYGTGSANPVLNDAVTAELIELRSGHTAKLGVLQTKLIDEQKAHAKTKAALEQAESDKQVLQRQLDRTANKSRAELQTAIDDLQAKHAALEAKHAETNMAYEQLLAVVSKPGRTE